MRYVLWINVKEGVYIYAMPSNSTRTLKRLARKLTVDSYIFDHLLNIKVWHRYADGKEVTEYNSIEEVLDGCKTYI